MRGIMVTAGQAAASDQRGGWLVPKADLVGVLQLLLQNRRLKIAPSLELAGLLAQELNQFQMRSVPLNAEALLEWRDRPNDDLVLAVATATWHGEHHVPCFCFLIDTNPEPLPHCWRRPLRR